ncbi:MAG: dihydrolipoyl dehydrogenase [Verrucomicrobia bacterium]|nr:dihydrolipoyl dehydrogenase [Verrucomicrobiota bacterium]MBU1909505.1 dihydrolipoyl dehydrogenase [Verrucomicrobiota bacterium]
MDKKQLVVIGGGPGGYPAAFLAADLGMKVTMVDPEANPGGVCLYRGCIPSKALLHVARLIHEAREAEAWGVKYQEPVLDLDRLRAWKESVVDKLTGGLGQLRQQRGIEFIRGRARLTGAQQLTVTGTDGKEQALSFEQAILATGSRPAALPGLPVSPRLWNSTAALNLEMVPATLLVVGGGYIGLELGSVYAALGSRVTVVEMLSGLLPGADRDLVAPLARRLEKQFAGILLNTKVAEMTETAEGLRVRFEGAGPKDPVQVFDRVLVSVGRKPNSSELGLENTRVALDTKGFVQVDGQRRTAEPTIFAIGDVAGEPMLAHKATHEARVAVEAALGKKTVFEPRAIPAVVFTDPEIAWCGVTETEAQKAGIPIRVSRFPWAASGRAITLDRPEGVTKLIAEAETGKILGMGITGPGAGDMIAEAALAIEMGATAEDLALTIHPHPTLSETLMEAAEVNLGHCTHVYRKRKEGEAK